MINIAGVQFRRAGKIYDFSYHNIDLRIGDQVLVDSEKGPSLVHVVSLKFTMDNEKPSRQLKSILRKTTAKDLATMQTLSPEDVLAFTNEKTKELGLNMRLLKCEVQFGCSKVMVYFNSPGRVDFRELVKELAAGLKVRVELKQVGARDETKLLGGLGICGREYCCSSFLREFVPVSIRMAKNQNLALNPNKVSGGCGRLLCCLTYENDVYTRLRQTLPPKGSFVRVLSTGELVRVSKSDLLNQRIYVENESGHGFDLSVEDVKMDSGASSSSEAQSQEGQEEWGDDLDLEELNRHL
ncbi:MAG: stage 0 sporulation protein [Oligoflexales bacterium]|nr:stage 0 sporulation protein [Oligoflexales bacterium]